MEHFTALDYTFISIILIFTGLFAGFFGAFFGIGGGTILVPTLLAIYTYLDLDKEIDMHQAVAASLALVIFNTLAAGYKHYKSKNIPVDFFKGWALWLFLGCVIASIIMAYVPALFLKIVFTTYLFLVVAYHFFKKELDKEKKDHLPQGAAKILGGIIMGGLSQLLGLAGGTFTTPYFSFFGCPVKKAMAISIAGGVLIGTVGTIAVIINGLGVAGRLPYSLGYVNLLTVALIAPFVVLSSPWGVKASARVPEKALNLSYTLFLLLLATYMLYHIIKRHF